MAEIIYTSNAPEALGPYSQAIVTGNMVFTSGQIAINPATNTVEAADIEGQTEQVMKNLEAVLTQAGSSFDKAVKTTCFLKICPTLPHLTESMENILLQSRQEAVLQ